MRGLPRWFPGFGSGNGGATTGGANGRYPLVEGYTLITLDVGEPGAVRAPFNPIIGSLTRTLIRLYTHLHPSYDSIRTCHP